MANPAGIPFQRALFGAEPLSFDATFAGVRRIRLDASSWVDHAEGWVRGADALFEHIVASRPWKQRTRWMYDHDVLEPRLTAPWVAGSGMALEPPLVEELRVALSARYGVAFDSVGFNLYRDGRDSVAWHRDKIRKDIAEPVIALVSLGERRKLLLRPCGGGASRAFLLGRGDLLVTGGRTNHDWEHTVPKVAQAGPRLSLAFRHGLDLRAYSSAAPKAPDEG